VRIGLVLSGGIAKGAYHIGILKAFREQLPRDFFCSISASSVGVLNGYAYLTDQLDAAENIWRTLNFNGPLGFARSFSKASYVDSLLKCFVTEGRPINGDFFVVSLSVPAMQLAYTNLRNVPLDKQSQYLTAGIALPPFRKPVLIDGTHHIDGAMVDNIPTLPLMRQNLDLVIVVYFDKQNFTFETPEFNSKVIRINFMDRSLLHDSFAFDENSVADMIERGHAAALEMIETFSLRNLPPIEWIYQKIEQMSRKAAAPTLRITGDILVNGLNSISKKLVQYRIIDYEAVKESDDSRIHFQ